LLGIPLVLCLLPALLAVFGSRASAPQADAPSRLGSVAAALVGHGLRRGGLWPLIAVGAIAVGGLALTQLETDPHAIHYFSPEHPLRRDHEAIEAQGLGLATLEVVVEADEPLQEEPLRRFAAAAEQLAGVQQVIGYQALEALAGQQRRSLPGSSAAERQSSEMHLLRQQFVLDEGRVHRFALILKTLGYADLQDLKRSVRAHFEDGHWPGSAKLTMTGNYSLLLAAQASLMRTLLSSLLISALLMQLVLALAARSMRLGLVALVPNLLPVFLGFILMWGLGIPLSVGTSMTAAVALGIAVDDTLHLIHSYNPLDPMATARGTGRALVTSSLVIAAGFAAIIPSSFLPARHFAVLAAAAMLTALAADLVVLPPLLAWSRYRSRN
jgi:predicted RND superfamily exporter protein